MLKDENYRSGFNNLPIRYNESPEYPECLLKEVKIAVRAKILEIIAEKTFDFEVIVKIEDEEIHSSLSLNSNGDLHDVNYHTIDTFYSL